MRKEKLMLVAWFMLTDAIFSFFASAGCLIKTSPIILGEDVELLCSGNCNDCEISWYNGDSPRKLLSVGTVSSEDTKYTAINRGAILIIHNVGTEDINRPYTCYYGFELCRKNLTLEDNNEYAKAVQDDAEKMFATNDSSLKSTSIHQVYIAVLLSLILIYHEF